MEIKHVTQLLKILMTGLVLFCIFMGTTVTVNADETDTLQWYLTEIGMPEEQEEVSVVIAVIDTGISTVHDALQDCLWVNEAEANGIEGVDDDGNGYIDDIHGFNVKSSNNNIEDTDGHGTHIAGTIAMQATGQSSVTGVCPQAKIMVIKAADTGNGFSSKNLVKAVRYARENGADVINMSLGTNSCSEELETEIRLAAENAVVVAAAGNYGKPTAESGFNSTMNFFPAGLDCVLGVMYFDEEHQLGTYSNWDYQTGTSVDYEVIAPGNNIYATTLGNLYKYETGTSMACAVTSGVCGYLVSEWKSLGDRQKADGNTISEIAEDCLVSGSRENISYTDSNGDVHLFPCVDTEGAISYMKENYTGDSNTGNSDNENSNGGNLDIGDADNENSNTGNLNTGDADNENSNDGNSNIGNSNTGDADNENSNDGNSNTGNSDNENSNTANPSTQKKKSTTAVIGKKYLVGKAYYKVLTKTTVSFVQPKKKTYQTFTIPKTVQIYGKTYRVTRIEDKAFYKNNKLVSVSIGNNVSIIGKKSFMGCSRLKKVIIGTGVKKIKRQAFYQCSKLRTLRIKSVQLSAVGKKAFGKISAKAVFYVNKKRKPALFCYCRKLR